MRFSPKHISLRFSALLAIALMATMAPVTKANAALVNELVNPGFETGDFTGWTVNNPSGFAFSAFVTTFSPFSGRFDAAFGGDSTSSASISQSVVAIPGDIYNISFEWRVSGNAPDGEFASLTDGANNVTLLNGTNAGNTPYALVELIGYKALTSSLTLTLGGFNVSNGILFDDASIADATLPLPGSLVLFLTALLASGLAFGAAKFRQRNKLEKIFRA